MVETWIVVMGVSLWTAGMFTGVAIGCVLMDYANQAIRIEEMQRKQARKARRQAERYQSYASFSDN